MQLLNRNTSYIWDLYKDTLADNNMLCWLGSLQGYRRRQQHVMLTPSLLGIRLEPDDNEIQECRPKGSRICHEQLKLDTRTHPREERRRRKKIAQRINPICKKGMKNTTHLGYNMTFLVGRTRWNFIFPKNRTEYSEVHKTCRKTLLRPILVCTYVL